MLMIYTCFMFLMFIHVMVCWWFSMYICILFTVFYMFLTGFSLFPYSVRQKYSSKVFLIKLYIIIFRHTPLFRRVYMCFCGCECFCRQNPIPLYMCAICARDCSCIMYILLEIYDYKLNCLRLSFWILLRKIDLFKLLN